jgi:hypothetical protein
VAAAVLLLGPAIGRAQNVELTGDYDQAQPAVSQSMAGEYAAEAPAGEYAAGVPVEGGPCPVCNGAGCAACDSRLFNRPCPDPCPRVGWFGFAGADSWRGVSDGTHQNNNGFSTGLNGGVPLPWLGTYGIGGQLGASYGGYDLNGQSVPAPGSSQVQQQIFITTGLFRRPDAQIPFGFGFVHDWMLNDMFGTFANSPTISQWRMQVGYAFNALNEIGVWGAVRDRGASKTLPGGGGILALPASTQSYQAINQVNLFWHHKWQRFGGDSWMYVGVPDQTRLNQTGSPFPAGSGGSLGEFILGGNWLVPISDCVSMYANTVYMKPSAHPGIQANGAIASAQEFWNFSVGLAFYPQRAARSTTVAGRTWMPYMPLANNGSFFVDTNRTQ